MRISICVEEALSILAPAFERHGIQCDAQISEELVAKGDPITLVQVLTNLLTNAKEALSTPGLVDKSIRIYTKQLPGGGASIIVEDNGIGIPADKLVSIFDQGFSTKRHGTGIGLHYCANAAQTMGWTLTATSEGVHQGAQMILEIPAERIVRKAA
jgi:signal transduction histidine kinase